uniref:Ubiquitin fusion degradation protein 1 homolog isoform X2 n=1 Tax=Nicotiana sylvestris TaxID=4096 RepID=A0A1U7WQT9_NICSY|nr:PREDICTED: ubiquitin fusion degradation protein 1 homolog isoform X2 [Nicotiana sylvestris]
MFFDGYGYHGTSFEQTYRCYPASFIDKPQIENGDKIIMPPSALDRLASLHIDYPMLFELRNAATDRVSHCGVLEFIAEEGMIYMPYWVDIICMMENLLLQEGDTVRVKNVTLPKGKYVKLQPHTKDFLDISNPKAILETTLRNFSCLTTGDSIMVAYNNKKYYIDIVESKPSNAISIIETDCEVDFAPPLDYKEPERPVQSLPSKTPAEGEEAAAEEEPKFNPFTGSARRLDGKPLKQQPPPVSTSGSKDKRPDMANATGQSAAGSSSQSSNRQTQGKLVFGSNANRNPDKQKEPVKEPVKEEPQKKEEPKFQAFTGKKYSLRG